ncbi:MAG: hypothetical protein ACOYD4_12035 [Solirubrobacterales bacterium]
MNPLRKGPEIKLPDVRVPGFVLDLYYDLRERHLLPVVGVLLVAIVAVPIALSQSSGPASSESGGASAATGSADVGKTGTLVAKSAPGLRADYRRRLRTEQVKDPFQQQYTGPREEAETGSSSDSSTVVESTETIESGGSSTSEAAAPSEYSTEPESGGEPTQDGAGELTYFSYAIDVRVVAGRPEGEAADSSPKTSTVRHALPELTMLPSRKTPAVVFIGASRDGKKALLLVSSAVESVFGDGVCALGSTTCQLLAVEPGLPETFVYGPRHRTFKIELLKLRLLRTDKPRRAPLGQPRKPHGGDRPLGALRGSTQPR